MLAGEWSGESRGKGCNDASVQRLRKNLDFAGSGNRRASGANDGLRAFRVGLITVLLCCCYKCISCKVGA